jgi:hypothetical protein
MHGIRSPKIQRRCLYLYYLAHQLQDERRASEVIIFHLIREPLRNRDCRSGISLPEEEARFASLFSNSQVNLRFAAFFSSGMGFYSVNILSEESHVCS